MLQNAYLLARFRFDTAENEPAKNLQILQKIAIFLLIVLWDSGQGYVSGDVRTSDNVLGAGSWVG